MKQLFIVANWKSNKTKSETIEWFQGLKVNDLKLTNKEIIVCPPFVFLSELRSYIINQKSSIKIGAQNISPYGEGAYTGEVNGKQIKELADYVLIGHSERRRYFGETDEVINKKLQMAFTYGLTPILCISDANQIINHKSLIINQTVIIAYEPIFAIGSGTPDTPENTDIIAKEIKQILPNVLVLYGGSVTEANVAIFTNVPSIDGVLIGGASLDPQKFTSIISNV